MAHSYQELMHFLKHGGDVQGTHYYPTNSFQMTPFDQPGRIASVGRREQDPENDYAKETGATYASENESLPENIGLLDFSEARNLAGNILHSTHLTTVPGIGAVRREWDPSKHVQSHSFPEKWVAGEMGHDGIMRLSDSRGVHPLTVTHEISHLVSRLGRQFTPHIESSGTVDPAHSWVFRRAHNLVLNSVGYNPDREFHEHEVPTRSFQEKVLANGPSTLPRDDQINTDSGAIDLQSVLNKQDPKSRQYVPRPR